MSEDFRVGELVRVESLPAWTKSAPEQTWRAFLVALGRVWSVESFDREQRLCKLNLNEGAGSVCGKFDRVIDIEARHLRKIGMPKTVFTDDELRRLANRDGIGGLPFTAEDDAADRFYREIVDEIMAKNGLLERSEWDHYGSGYASFIEAWLYAPTPDYAVLKPVYPGEADAHEYEGLAVALCRLGPYYCLQESEKCWRKDGGSGGLVYLGATDILTMPGPIALAPKVDALLSSRGLTRLRYDDLTPPLPDGIKIESNLTEFHDDRKGILRVWDAVFNWMD